MDPSALWPPFLYALLADGFYDLTNRINHKLWLLLMYVIEHLGAEELVAASGIDRVTPVGGWSAATVTIDELKRRYRAKQEQIRELEAERAWFLERGEPVPWRIGYRLEMARIEAEELRMWGHRELVRLAREGV